MCAWWGETLTLSVKKGQHQQKQQLTGFPAQAGVTVFASLAAALLKLHIWRPKREGVCLNKTAIEQANRGALALAGLWE